MSEHLNDDQLIDQLYGLAENDLAQNLTPHLEKRVVRNCDGSAGRKCRSAAPGSPSRRKCCSGCPGGTAACDLFPAR